MMLELVSFGDKIFKASSVTMQPQCIITAVTST